MKKPFLIIIMMLSWSLAACDADTKSVSACGDGFLDPAEQCDGAALPVTDCLGLGYYLQFGPLACRDDCSLDLTVCAGRCGDGIVQTLHGEQCDGEHLAGETCGTLGLGQGALACAADCTFDTAGCEVATACGDGSVSDWTGEQCDGENLRGATCASEGLGEGTLGCTDDCTLDPGDCARQPACGDGTLQAWNGEECDGDDAGSKTCANLGLGFYGGHLACTADCRLDFSSCVGFCGDGAVQRWYGEECEGSHLAGQTCESLGLGAGTLACGAGCTFDVSGCDAIPVCGDGVIFPWLGEECDGDNLGGASCRKLGYNGGDLVCSRLTCTFETAACEPYGRCGDGQLQAEHGEHCEGRDLGGASCASLGLGDGVLACAGCRFDTAGCQRQPGCGDGTITGWTGEECDGDDLGGITGCTDLGFHEGPVFCGADCRLDTSFCATYGACGDGVIQAWYGEECDGTDLGEAGSCTALGYYGGALSCTPDCRLDTSRCGALGACGDGVIQAAFGETCDGDDLGGVADCAALGWHDGPVFCGADCRLDTTYCAHYGRCGDGVLQHWFGEECDGANFGGAASCADLGYHEGPLVCGADCRTLLTYCEAFGRCGDGVIQAGFGETCDGAALGNTCVGLGYYGGTPGCTATCALDGDPCERCGDGVLQEAFGEACDGAALGALSCRAAGFWRGQAVCAADCASADHDACVRFVAVSARGQHACALDELGAAWCWGSGGWGQLGQSLMQDAWRPVPVTMPAGRTFVKIAAGYEHTCAIDDLGGAWCWGRNHVGQLGTNSTTASTVPVAVDASQLPVGRTFGAIGLGGIHTCALDNTGKAWCWGFSEYGQLGTGGYHDQSLIPKAVSTGEIFNRLAVGFETVCGLTPSGYAQCWGAYGHARTLNVDPNVNSCSGYNALYGNYTLPYWMQWVQYTALSVGYRNTCVLNPAGAALCSGENSWGQLGDGTTTGACIGIFHGNMIGSVMPGGVTFIRIENNAYDTCALDTTGRVWCWGAQGSGETGLGVVSSSPQTTPAEVLLPPGRFTDISVGFSFACALAETGAVWCWGYNGNGRLGDGTLETRATPVPVSEP